MAASDPASLTLAVRAAAARLRIDSATAEVLRAFDAAGVQTILLKGASSRQWLERAPGEARWYADCDLLVRPEDHEAAARVLNGLGFIADLDAGKMPAWWREHDLSWRRRDDEAIIDLHRTLPGLGVDDARAWALLSADAHQIVVGGYAAQAPAIPARAMHLALHAAHHGPNWSMGLGDLERALERADEDTWGAAAALADRLDATPAFVAGLRTVPAGRALVERLGLESAPALQTALLGERSRAPAVTIERLVRADSLRKRLSMTWRKLIPPVTFMRHWSPLARRGRLGLLLAYLWRPVWVLVRAPAAVAAWRRAR